MSEPRPFERDFWRSSGFHLSARDGGGRLVNRRRVVTLNDGKPGERSISVACMHCSDPPCMAVIAS